MASHIGGEVTLGNRRVPSSRHHMLNSFVPNLLWLPVQISKLTDREGSLAQKLLQAISYRIYSEVAVPREISRLWQTLTCPADLQGLNVDLTRISYFVVPKEWLEKRVDGLVSEIDMILSIDRIENYTTHKVKSRRYLPTLKQRSVEQRLALNEGLATYKSLLLLPA